MAEGVAAARTVLLPLLLSRDRAAPAGDPGRAGKGPAWPGELARTKRSAEAQAAALSGATRPMTGRERSRPRRGQR